MLHRAANNAYSWWWASHIRTKQSKWLDNNLQEMEEKVQYMLKLIDEDGDSFARRAESYYRKRPELINFVEEFYRAYRALAEKYDHISGELQNANHTIATVFPDRVQFAMDEDEEAGSPHISAAFRPSLSKSIPDVPKAVPKFIKNLKKGKGSLGRPPKIHPNKIKSTTTNSNMSKEEAIQEIDKLQKGILALQTEKEFVKSSYENRLAKYWEIEKSITEMQQKVCSLQDEFRVGTLIEDHEARTLMASTALNSCQQTLAQLQEKQERSNEEARVEQERIKEVHLKFEAFKGEFLQNQTGQNPFDAEATSEDPTVRLSEQGVGDIQEETVDAESIREKIREQFQIIYGNDLSVSELAEKIDELATKVISLETAVSTQTALIRRLKSETDSLQENLRTLEEDKAAMLQDSTKLNEKLRELEGKLHEVQDLGKNVDNQNNNLQTHFTEANCNLDHLSEKLKDVKPDEETEITGSLETEDSLFPTVDQRKKQEPGDEMVPSEEPANEKAKLTGEEEVQEHNSCVTDPGEGLEKSTSSGQPEDVSEASPDIKKLGDGEKQPDSSRTEDTESQEEPGDQEDEPNWQQLFSNGLEDRERLLLGEYTAIVRKYKEARKQLSELQRKNNDGEFETMVQLRELKNAIAMKDEEIQSLRRKLKSMQESEQASENSQQEEKAQDMLEALSSQPHSSPVANVEQQAISDSLQDQKDEATPRSDVSTPGNSPKSLTHTEEEEELKVPPVDEPRHVSSIEEKFRKDIDGLLEENLDFWMRFSELFHQIQKFQTSIKDLKNEYTKIKENKNSEEGSSSSKHSDSLRSDARPIYKHLREIQTELTVWIEKNMLLKDEVKYRLASLGNIQEEIERVSHHSSGTDEEFTSYQAAKFQGEVLNMEQENNKVAGELQAGLEHVKELQFEIDNTLTQMDDELKLSGSRIHHHHNVIHSLSRTRIPLRSLLFGVRAKKQKQPSFFACINPTLNKQHSDLDGGYAPL